VAVLTKTTDGDAGGIDGGKGDNDNSCDGDSDGWGHRQKSTKTATKETAVAAAAAAAVAVAVAAAAAVAAMVTAKTAEAAAWRRGRLKAEAMTPWLKFVPCWPVGVRREEGQL